MAFLRVWQPAEPLLVERAETARQPAIAGAAVFDPGYEARFQRRDASGQFAESDDVGRSLVADRRQHAATKKPRNEGDKGD